MNSSTSASSSFRGYRAIQEVVARMEKLADWFAAYRPEVKAMTLTRRDLDLLQRWPKAAALFHIYTLPGGGTHWRGFTLLPDKSPPRYEKGDYSP